MSFLQNNLLSLMMIMPVLGAAILLIIKHADAEIEKRNIRQVSLLITTITFVLSLVLWAGFDNSTAEFQFVEQHAWIGDDISYYIGVDGISMLFVVLTAFLMPIVVLASWDSVQDPRP